VSPYDTVSLSDTVKMVRGFTRVPNTVLHSLIQVLDGTEYKVYIRLFCLSHGYGKDTCTVGYDRLSESVGLGRTATKKATKKLQTLGLIRKVSAENTPAGKAPTYQVTVPGGALEPASGPRRDTVAQSDTVSHRDPNKEKTEKEHEKAPAAGAPADVFEVRKIAARVREVHHGQLGYSPVRFREDVRTALLGAGRDADDETIDEATKGMAL
jgi:hypothetical protein